MCLAFYAVEQQVRLPEKGTKESKHLSDKSGIGLCYPPKGLAYERERERGGMRIQWEEKIEGESCRSGILTTPA